MTGNWNKHGIMLFVSLILCIQLLAIDNVESACNSINIVSRIQWGARTTASGADNLPPKNIPVKYVYIHHTAGSWYSNIGQLDFNFEPRCFSRPECIKNVQRVERIHMDDRGYDDIGYNYLVGEDGNAYEGRGWRKYGSHSYGYNSLSVAICVMGNFVDDTPNSNVLGTIQSLIDCAIDDGVLSPNYELFGHKDIGDTECPGPNLYDRIKLLPKFSTKVMQKYKDKQKVPLPPPCMAYGDITKIKVTGASSATAAKEGLKFSGKPASNYILDQDIVQLESHRNCFVQVGQEYGIHPALIAAIASRVSRVGKNMTSKGYGIMQCDTSSQVFGSRCQDFGPTSCEHIRMMVDDKLVPDIRTAMEDYYFNKEIKGQRDAIAAYDHHTVAEVQSWKTPDSGTSGRDFSSDVITRAHRLIQHHKWTCDGLSPSPNLPGTSTPVHQPGSDNCQVKADRGDCNFYIDCVENVVQCNNDGYAVGYGYKYCNRFADFYDSFTSEGKAWIDAVRICLMNELIPHIHKDQKCTALKNIAFDTHVDCYVNSGPGICNIVDNNIGSLWSVYQVKDFFSISAWKQVIGTIATCSKNAYDEGIASFNEFFNEVDRQINAWERSIIEEAIRNRGKRSTDCDQYATSGDCRFYECFEDKFACADHFGQSHIRDFELTSCMKFQGLGNEKVSSWMKKTQVCLMNHLMTLYTQDSLYCPMVELHMMEARVSCMVDAGFCDLDISDELMLERATNMNNFPLTTPVSYTSLPLSQSILLINDYYYQTLPWLQRQIGLARKECSGSENMYTFVDTANYGLLKMRTEL